MVDHLRELLKQLVSGNLTESMMPSMLCIIWEILCAFSGIKRSTVKMIIKEYEEGGGGGSVLFSTPKRRYRESRKEVVVDSFSCVCYT